MSQVSSSHFQHYGEVPDYLQQRNEEERRAQEEYDNFVKEQRERGAMKHLSDEERQAVLEVLQQIGCTMAVLPLNQQGIAQTSGTTGGAQEIN